MKLTTRDKRTVLHSAAEAGHLGVIRLLLASGSDALAKDGNGHYARDLVQNRDSVEVKGLFSAYMEASLGNQDDIRGRDETVDNPAPPSQTEPEETVVPETETPGNLPDPLPDIDLVAIRSWELLMTSSEEEAGTHVWNAPRLELVEPTPPGSPTGSDTNERALEVYRKELKRTVRQMSF